MTVVPTQDDLRQLLNDINWVAGKGRRSNSLACDWYHLTPEAKLEQFNSEVLPQYEVLGCPAHLTDAYHAFTARYFEAK